MKIMMMVIVMMRMMRFFFLLSNTFFTDLRLSKAGLRKEGFPSDRYLLKRKIYIAIHIITFGISPNSPALWEKIAWSKSIFDEPLDHFRHSRVAELVRQHVPEEETSPKCKNITSEIVST